MNVLSLFDGMSGGSIALKELGIKADKYFASEIKKHGIKVTQHNHPNVIQIGDVTKVTYENGILNTENGSFKVGHIDLILAGTPCQNFSPLCLAEKRLGLDGEKSKLFYEFHRLLGEVKPTYFFMENVSGMNDESRDFISELLGVTHTEVNSKLLTAQLRGRYYWTNIPFKGDFKDRNVKFQDILTSGYTNREKALCLLEGHSRPNSHMFKTGRRYFRGLINIVFENEENYLKCKDIYDQKGKGKKASEWENSLTEEEKLEFDKARLLNKTEMERLQGVPEGYTSVVSINESASLLGDGWTNTVIVEFLRGLK